MYVWGRFKVKKSAPSLKESAPLIKKNMLCLEKGAISFGTKDISD
jgi:hypothetical protein